MVHTGLLLFVLWYWWKPKSSNYMVGFFVGKASRNVRNNWICKFQTKLFESGYSWYSLHFFYFLTPFYYNIQCPPKKKFNTKHHLVSTPNASVTSTLALPRQFKCEENDKLIHDSASFIWNKLTTGISGRFFPALYRACTSLAHILLSLKS